MATVVSIANVSSDVNSLLADVKNALSSPNQSNWNSVINDLTSLVADMGSLAKINRASGSRLESSGVAIQNPTN